MNDKRRIIFVDDDINILSSLKRMVYPMRDRWYTRFENSAEDALKALDEEEFDIIITDLRMPKMNGLELLMQVKKKHTHVIRIILSAQSEREVFLRSFGPVHQFLSKPCSFDDLKSAVERVCSLRKLLVNDDIRGLASKLESLPTIPPIYLKLMEMVKSTDVSVKRVAEIISSDPGMSAKILQLVNSAYFGISHQVTEPEMAVSLLGLDTIIFLALTVQIFRQFDREMLPGYSLDKLWRHSLETSSLARAFARTVTQQKDIIDGSLVAGLLHDVGKLVLIDNLRKQYQWVLFMVSSKGIPVHEAERVVFGATHGEVGAYLLGLWGLQDRVVEAVAYHHQPRLCPGESFTPLTTVHVANVLQQTKSAPAGEAPVKRIDTEYLASLGLEERLPQWEEISRKTTRGERI